MLKLISIVLVLCLVFLQYQVWYGDSGIKALTDLELQLENQRVDNVALASRNRQLEIEILDLKNGLEAVEERARSELGMIGKGETFYLIVE